MRHRIALIMVVAAALLVGSEVSKADHGVATYNGGAFSTGSSAGQSIAVKSAPVSVSGATISFNCPITQYTSGTTQLTWVCAGGSVSIASASKALVFQGTFVSGSMTFSGSGGGKGSTNSYAYGFTGSVSGTITSGGATQAAYGSVGQTVTTGGQIGSSSVPVSTGSFGWNSAYSPLLVADNAKGRIVRADSITGANLASYGSLGNGTGQFMNIAGMAQDASHRIYVTDSVLNRVVRMDDISGKNWVEIGSYGTGTNHFYAPKGIAVDAAGKIWVVDSGNDRIVRMDSMSGTNWVSMGAPGNGAKQFFTPNGIALDGQGRVYVADSGNSRLVRFDDATGKNWTALTQVSAGVYGYLLNGVSSVAVNGAGQIFVSAGTTTGFLIRADGMSGTNAVVSRYSTPLTSLSLDAAGTIYFTGPFNPGLAEEEDAAATGYFASGLGGAVQQPNVVSAVRVSTPTPAAPTLSATALAFGSENVGEKSVAQAVTLTNLGAGTLTIGSITASSDFPLANTCGTSLKGGASCKVSIVFDPVTTGTRTANLTVNSSGAHPVITARLSGVGVAPKVVILPSSLVFGSQLVGSTSGPQSVTLTNTGTGALAVSSLKISGDFSLATNCGKTVAAGNGCTVQVSFKPAAAGTRGGALTFADNAVAAGTQQVVGLSGVGSSTAPALTLSPESIQFAAEEVGTVSAAQATTLTNHLNKAVALSALSYPSQFKVTSTCGSALAAGAHCSFNAAFAPASAGAVTGKATFSAAGIGTQSFALSGESTAAGMKASLVVSPSSIDFGQVVVGDSASLTFTIKNSSGLPVAIHNHGLTGSADFHVTTYTCPGTMGGGTGCTVSVTYTPTNASGAASNGVYAITEGSGAVIHVAVAGTGIAGGGM